MKVLIGGLLGAVASVAAWIGLEKVLESEYAWLALAVGLITGLATSIAAGKTTSGAYLRGAMAAVLTLAAIYSAPKIKEQMMHAEAKKVSEKVENVVNNDISEDEGTEAEVEGDAEAKPAAGDKSTVDSIVARGEGAVGAANSSALKKPGSDEYLEMGWMCGAALVAYLVGKGSDEAKVAEDSSETPQEDPPQDTGDEGAESA